MSLRNLSNLSSPMPSQVQGIPSRLGGGKGMAGSSGMRANPQSALLQQLMQAMMARRQNQMQNPGFMSPIQRLETMPQMPQQAQLPPPPSQTPPALPAQASPVAVQAVQGNTPGMQAQQDTAIAQQQQEAQRAAAAIAAPPAPQWQYMNQVPQDYMQSHGGIRDFFTWDPAKQMWRGKDNNFYQDNPTDFSYGR